MKKLSFTNLAQRNQLVLEKTWLTIKQQIVSMFDKDTVSNELLSW
jgi:hypothetical protein